MNNPFDPSAIISPYKQAFELALLESMHALGESSVLRDACCYAVGNGGKRFRPALVMMVAEGLGHGANVSEVARAVEFFHAASLIADDLPCMDNEEIRRGKPTVHRVYGEATALLASYALIAAGYGCFAKNSQILKRSKLPFADRADAICVLALENAAHNTGLSGASGGQFLDLFPPEITDVAICEIFRKKTGALFELSFVVGWLYGGGNPSKLDLVKQMAHHFGMAFQMADDLQDLDQDLANGCFVNLARLLGPESAIQRIDDDIQAFLEIFTTLELENSSLENLVSSLKELTKIPPKALCC